MIQKIKQWISDGLAWAWQKLNPSVDVEIQSMRGSHPQDIRACYRSVFSSKEGQLVLRHIAKKAHVWDSTFTQGDACQTAFNEGARRLALSILRYVYRDERELYEHLKQGATIP